LASKAKLERPERFKTATLCRCSCAVNGCVVYAAQGIGWRNCKSLI